VIVKRPAFVFEPALVNDSQTFFRILTTALLFSNGFYLDAAWLHCAFVRDLFEKVTFGLPRLAAKGYMPLATRIPRAELDFAWAPKWLREIQMWEWPIPIAPPERRETEDGFLIFVEKSWLSSSDAIPLLGSVIVDSEKVNRMFIRQDKEADTSDLDLDIFNGIGAIEIGSVEVDHSSTDRVLFWIELDQVFGLLKSNTLNQFLGVARTEAMERLHLCEKLRNAVMHGNQHSVFNHVQESALIITEKWGLKSHHQAGETRIGISFQESLGFLFSWKF
jgi:hypothetical protein